MKRSWPYEVTAATLLLFTPLAIRVLTQQPLLPAADSYKYLYGASLEPYALLLRLLAPLGDARILLSLILGIISVVLFRRVAERLTSHDTLAVLLFLLNPLFLSLFTSMTPLTLALPLGLLALDAVLARRFRLAALLLVFLGPVAPLLGLGASLLFLFFLREWRHALPGIIVGALFLSLFNLLGLWRPHLNFPVAEFGAPFGLSLLLCFLSLIEAILRWNERRRQLTVLTILLLVAAPVGFLPFASVATLPLAASFLGRLRSRRWALPDAQPVVLLLIGCTLLFLTLTNILAVARQAPSSNLFTTLAALPPDEGKVLAPPSLAPIVAATGHPVLEAETECEEERCRAVQRLFSSWRVTDADPVLRSLNVTYLLITEEQRRTEWNRDDEGLLFVLPNSPRFTLLIEDEEEQLWRYSG